MTKKKDAAPLRFQEQAVQSFLRVANLNQVGQAHGIMRGAHECILHYAQKNPHERISDQPCHA